MKVKLLKYIEDNAGYEATRVCKKAEINVPRAFVRAVEAGHTSLLEHLVFQFSINGISRACSHQLVRHRVASYAQESQRYVKIDEENWYIIPDNVVDFKAYHSLMEVIKASYNQMIANGTPLEDARYILPNSCKTNLVMTINGRSLDNFLRLRTCSHAQWEIRELAQLMLKEVQLVSRYFESQKYPKCNECRTPCGKGETNE